MVSIITARKRSLGQGNMFTGLCLSTLSTGGGGFGAIPSCLAAGLQQGLQAHTQGGSGGGSGPGPHPRGKLRGIWSRPTPKGEVEGDLPRGCLLWGGCLVPGGACSRGCLLRGGLVLGGCLVETSRRLLLRVVRILLECILVWKLFILKQRQWLHKYTVFHKNLKRTRSKFDMSGRSLQK